MCGLLDGRCTGFSVVRGLFGLFGSGVIGLLVRVCCHCFCHSQQCQASVAV